jgi:uncharacterized protein (TIGR02996 family)
MKPTPECIALLRSIAAAPDDDTPRLVFADWLDENSSEDADLARAEFIRLSCKMKKKSLLSAAEGRWLDANVSRLLPTFLAKLRKGNILADAFKRKGRWVTIRVNTVTDAAWSSSNFGDAARGHIDVKLEFWRGFVRRAIYGLAFGTSFHNAGVEIAMDEPLAQHETESRLERRYIVPGSQHWINQWTVFGEEVWQRIQGHDPNRSNKQSKVFVYEKGQYPDAESFINAVKAAMDTAMTQHIRAQTPWPVDWTAS